MCDLFSFKLFSSLFQLQNMILDFMYICVNSFKVKTFQTRVFSIYVLSTWSFLPVLFLQFIQARKTENSINYVLTTHGSGRHLRFSKRNTWKKHIPQAWGYLTPSLTLYITNTSKFIMTYKQTNFICVSLKTKYYGTFWCIRCMNISLCFSFNSKKEELGETQYCPDTHILYIYRRPKICSLKVEIWEITNVCLEE